MSSRDTSDLYTGSTSATNDPKSTPREQQAEKKERSKQKLTVTGAEVVFEIIEKERATVCDIRSFVVSPALNDAAVKAELVARNKHLDFLNRLEGHIKNIMNSQPRKKKEFTDE